MTQTFVGMEAVAQDLILPRECGTQDYGKQKVQTALLLRPKSANGTHITSVSDVDAIAYGDHAESEYCKIPADERDGYIFLKWFKMSLWSRGATPDPVLPKSSVGGCSVSLSVALAKALELFKGGAMDHLRLARPDIAAPSDVVWTLTIPAIWQEGAKHLMRSAAHTAGLIDDINSENLILCLEPEGIAFAALVDNDLVVAPGVASVGGGPGFGGAPAAAKPSKTSAQIAAVLKTQGAKFVILDAGGGTMDIA